MGETRCETTHVDLVEVEEGILERDGSNAGVFEDGAVEL